eukprot:jgi/Chrzof1/1856/Cz10g23250.t1
MSRPCPDQQPGFGRPQAPISVQPPPFFRQPPQWAPLMKPTGNAATGMQSPPPPPRKKYMPADTVANSFAACNFADKEDQASSGGLFGAVGKYPHGNGAPMHTTDVLSQACVWPGGVNYSNIWGALGALNNPETYMPSSLAAGSLQTGINPAVHTAAVPLPSGAALWAPGAATGYSAAAAAVLNPAGKYGNDPADIESRLLQGTGLRHIARPSPGALPGAPQQQLPASIIRLGGAAPVVPGGLRLGAYPNQLGGVSGTPERPAMDVLLDMMVPTSAAADDAPSAPVGATAAASDLRLASRYPSPSHEMLTQGRQNDCLA